MVSVVIPTRNAEGLLPRCFDSLIAAVVRGVVREVIVADGGSTDGTLGIADAVGAHLVRAGQHRAEQLRAGAGAARGDWLLFMEPNTALEPGWDHEVESFLNKVTLERPRAASFRLAIDNFGVGARCQELGASLRSALFGLPSCEQSLLIPKRLYLRLGGHRDVVMEDLDLARRIGRRNLVMLRARAVRSAEEHPAATRNLTLTALHAMRAPRRMMSLLGG
jgi:glycosyltransferase involved in cell wall biosynthesis